MMTRPYILVENPPIAYDIPTGGHLAVVGGEVSIPQTVACTATGVGLGPVQVGVPEGDHAAVETLEWTPEDDEDGGWISLSVAAGASAGAVAADRRQTDGQHLTFDESDHPKARRRTVLGAAAGLVTSGLLSVTVSAEDDDLVTLTIAEVEFTAASGPIQVSVLDIVDEVLPSTTDLLVDVEGTRTGEITDPGVGTTIAAEDVSPGTVRVYLRDSLGKLAQILAWARGLLPGSAEVTYSRTFPDDTKASDYDEGEFVTLTEHPSIVTPVEEGDPEETRLVIGNTIIPNESTGGNGSGAWSVFSDSVIYEAGSDPPASGEYTITVGLGLVEQFLSR